MASEHTIDSFEGNYKVVYGDKLVRAVPDNVLFTRLTKMEGNQLGKELKFPVCLRLSQGFTYKGSAANAVKALQSPIASQDKEATVDASEIIHRDQISYKSVAKATSGGKSSFVKATRHLFMNAIQSANNRLEFHNWYGQAGLLDFAADAVDNPAAGSGTRTLSVADSAWANAIATTFEGAYIEFRDQAAEGTVLANGATYRIVSFDLINKDIVVQEVTPGTGADVTSDTNSVQLDTDINTTNLAARAYLYDSYGNEFGGVRSILTETSSLFGINPSDYTNWGGNAHSVTGLVTLDHIDEAVEVAVSRGYQGDMVAFCSPKVWRTIHKNLPVAKRDFDASYDPKEAKIGVQAITFYSQAGRVSVLPHNFIKNGDIFVLPGTTSKLKGWGRLGGTDWTNHIPGSDGKLFKMVPGYDAWEYQMYTLQAPYTEAPQSGVLLTGFTL